MIVADTNLIAYLFISGPDTTRAEEVFEKDPIWAAPALWRNEMRNVLGGYMRNRGLPLRDALAIMADAEALLEGNEQQVESAQVLAAAFSSGCAAYDCEFVLVAEALRVPLVTADRKVLRTFPQVAVSLEDFVA